MKPFSHSPVALYARASLLVSLITLQLAVMTAGSFAQTPVPVASPMPTSSPLPTASPTPLDPAVYLPQASVQLPVSTVPTTPTLPSGLKTNSSSPSSQTLEVCAPDVFSITSLETASQAVTVTLTYDASCVGSKATIASLDGGTINGTPGAKQILVASDGTAVFTFQPPADPGLYNVVTTLGGYQRVLPFRVASKAN